MSDQALSPAAAGLPARGRRWPGQDMPLAAKIALVWLVAMIVIAIVVITAAITVAIPARAVVIAVISVAGTVTTAVVAFAAAVVITIVVTTAGLGLIGNERCEGTGEHGAQRRNEGDCDQCGAGYQQCAAKELGHQISSRRDSMCFDGRIMHQAR